MVLVVVVGIPLPFVDFALNCGVLLLTRPDHCNCCGLFSTSADPFPYYRLLLLHKSWAKICQDDREGRPRFSETKVPVGVCTNQPIIKGKKVTNKR